MLQANELRPGNWIYEIRDRPENPKSKEPFKVAGVNALYNTVIDADDNITQLDYCELIELTTELLKQSGFLHIDYRYYIDGFMLWHNTAEGQFQYYKTDGLFIVVDSLHQLQNLYFALEGTELEINL